MFLGMPVPKAEVSPQKKRVATPSEWLRLSIMSLILAGAIHLWQVPFIGPTVAPLAQTQITTRILGGPPPAIAKPVATQQASPKTFCNLSDPNSHIADTFNAKTITPILPTVILDGSVCSPPYWGLDIIKIFIYKVMSLLNYLILTAAIILTIYAGILYLTGFQSEANIKKSKTILTSTYIGLIISLSATLILRTTISIAADSKGQNVINDNNGVIFSGGN